MSQVLSQSSKQQGDRPLTSFEDFHHFSSKAFFRPLHKYFVGLYQCVRDEEHASTYILLLCCLMRVAWQENLSFSTKRSLQVIIVCHKMSIMCLNVSSFEDQAQKSKQEAILSCTTMMYSTTCADRQSQQEWEAVLRSLSLSEKPRRRRRRSGSGDTRKASLVSPLKLSWQVKRDTGTALPSANVHQYDLRP